MTPPEPLLPPPPLEPPPDPPDPPGALEHDPTDRYWTRASSHSAELVAEAAVAHVANSLAGSDAQHERRLSHAELPTEPLLQAATSTSRAEAPTTERGWTGRFMQPRLNSPVRVEHPILSANTRGASFG